VIRSKLLLAALACLLASALASVGVAQQIQAPMFGGVGARAIGMGGAFVAVADGTTGPQWNPAGEANGRFAVPLGAVGVAQNFEANNIQDLLNDLDDARDGSVAAAQSLLLDALDWQNIQVAAAPYLSLGPVRGFTLYGNVQASGMAKLAAVDAGGNRVLDVGDSVTALAGVAALGNVGLACSRPAGEGWRVGLAVKQITMKARQFNYQAALAAGPVLNVTPLAGDTPEVDDSAFTADLGFLYRPEDSSKLSFGLVVRDITRPDLTDQGITMVVPRQIDVGIATEGADGIKFAADVHDLTGARNGSATLHFGAEKQLRPWLTGRVGMFQLPRAQFNDSLRLVGGLGVQLGGFRLDVAAGTSVKKLLSGEISWTF